MGSDGTYEAVVAARGHTIKSNFDDFRGPANVRRSVAPSAYRRSKEDEEDLAEARAEEGVDVEADLVQQGHATILRKEGTDKSGVRSKQVHRHASGHSQLPSMDADMTGNLDLGAVSRSEAPVHPYPGHHM